MLPIQLKPKSQKTVGIKYEKVISFIKEIPLKTPKQQEALNYIKEHPLLPVKDCPYSLVVLNNIEKQGAIQIIQQEVYRDPYHEKMCIRDSIFMVYVVMKYIRKTIQ